MKMKIHDVHILVNAAKCSGRGILQGFLSVAGTRPDFRMHICEMSQYGRKSLIEAIASGHVDGFVTSEIEDPELSKLLEAVTFPTVVIGTRNKCLPKRTQNLRIVTTSEERLSSAGAVYLMNCGRCASYGYVHFREDFCQYLSMLRERGFASTLRQSGLSLTSYSTTLSEERSDIGELGAWIAALPKPAAILVGYDRRAAEVLNSCELMGIRVPEDVSVLGIDNDEIICNQTKPQLSSISTDNICEGRTAARQLISLLRKPCADASRKTVLSPATISIVERESTRVIAPGLSIVRRANAYIAENASHSISVNDVVSHMGVSRRLAYLRFREFEHKSIHQAILTARIAHVKRRLLGSRQKIDAIARDCGFNNPNNLKIIFRRLTGMTMREWRARNARQAPRR